MTMITYLKYPLAPFQPLDRLTKPICRRCNCEMNEGLYTKQTFVSGIIDFPNDTRASTFSAGGTGKLDECLKCPECGHSITKG